LFLACKIWAPTPISLNPNYKTLRCVFRAIVTTHSV